VVASGVAWASNLNGWRKSTQHFNFVAPSTATRFAEGLFFACPCRPGPLGRVQGHFRRLLHAASTAAVSHPRRRIKSTTQQLWECCTDWRQWLRTSWLAHPRPNKASASSGSREKVRASWMACARTRMSVVSHASSKGTVWKLIGHLPSTHLAVDFSFLAMAFVMFPQTTRWPSAGSVSCRWMMTPAPNELLTSCAVNWTNPKPS
jgi:hypothetical protein